MHDNSNRIDEYGRLHSTGADGKTNFWKRKFNVGKSYGSYRDGEEYEQIFISDTQFVEIHYGNMELPVSVVDEQVDDPFYYDYYKKDIEKMILNEEMAKDVAFVLLKPYFSKFSGNIFFCVQYIPDYGYYFVDIGRYESVVGYRVELVLDEKDGRVVYLWDIDPSLG